jgi:hypothetical protein
LSLCTLFVEGSAVEIDSCHLPRIRQAAVLSDILGSILRLCSRATYPQGQQENWKHIPMTAHPHFVAQDAGASDGGVGGGGVATH